MIQLQNENCQLMDQVAKKGVRLEEGKQKLEKEAQRIEQASTWISIRYTS